MEEQATNELTIAAEPPVPVVPVEVVNGDMYRTPAIFEHVQRVAKVFAASKLVPEAYRGNIADCIIAMEMATRLQVAPLAIMQNTYMVHGKPGLEGKFVIALINTRGPYPDGIEFKYEGEGANRAITARGVRKSGREDSLRFTLAEAKAWGWLDKADSAWKKNADQMLAYRSGVFLARRYCPEVLLGVPPPADELIDVVE